MTLLLCPLRTLRRWLAGTVLGLLGSGAIRKPKTHESECRGSPQVARTASQTCGVRVWEEQTAETSNCFFLIWGTSSMPLIVIAA